MVPLKVLMMAAFLLALPVVMYQIWAFVAPGLYGHEKALVAAPGLLPAVLFYIGCGVLLVFRVWTRCSRSSRALHPKSITAHPTSRPT
jgi:sec-independent protein translocase protein TatC